jgi:DNA repair exonuclease SbcCD ATPase subunit
MNKKAMPLLVGALCIMVGISGFCLYEYIALMRGQAGLEAELSQSREDLRLTELVRDNFTEDIEKALADEKALILENTGLKDQAKADRDKFAAAIREAQANIDSLAEQMSVAIAENTALVSQIDGLKTRLAASTEEKDRMTATLNSIDELKKAIKDLRLRTRRARRSGTITIAADTKKQVEEITLGNQGFIIKNGKLTYPSRVKIEVQASPEITQ